jgi:aspartate 1-decarboxylase
MPHRLKGVAAVLRLNSRAIRVIVLGGPTKHRIVRAREFRVQRILFRSKIHRATLTGTELDYEGSIAIDRTLMEAADLVPGEQVHVLNLSNAERLITYVIEAPAGSGTMMLNGPAARLGQVGDKVVILAYAVVDDAEARSFKPKIVHVDEKNRIA